MYSICILILILDMFCAGFPRKEYCLAAYSLSCRGRFADTGIIWNMLLIMFPFVWKNNFSTYISLWHMLLYVGTCCDSGAWRAPKRGCCQPTSSPQTGMYVFLSLVVHHFPSRYYICMWFTILYEIDIYMRLYM